MLPLPYFLVRWLAHTVRWTKNALCVLGLSLFVWICTLASSANASDLNVHQSLLAQLVEQARNEARSDYQIPSKQSIKVLNELSYDAYRAIRFQPEQALWRGESDYEVQFFHGGFLYDRGVEIFTLSAEKSVAPLPFRKQAFSYSGEAATLADQPLDDARYSGFRVHYPLNRDDYKDEFLVFQGASYFRLIGQHQVYGLSARALAINTGLPQGEEFPHFERFYLVQPQAKQALTILATLNSPSITGVYEFTVEPNASVVMDVRAWLFAREDIQKLGLAPVTSMFLYGEHSARKPDDFRPQVHDSDGIGLLTESGERIWRPLTNPSTLQITALSDTAPQGFGALQRDTNFNHYLDSEARYERRPGLWITPKQGFGTGHLEVVEIPVNAETHDNIVSYWVNQVPMKQGDESFLSYQIRTVDGKHDVQPYTIVRTRQGQSHLPGFVATHPNARRFVVDFSMPQQSSPVQLEHHLSAVNATVLEQQLQMLPEHNMVRVSFVVAPHNTKTIDMRLSLANQGETVSEVWNYVLQTKA